MVIEIIKMYAALRENKNQYDCYANRFQVMLP